MVTVGRGVSAGGGETGTALRLCAPGEIQKIRSLGQTRGTMRPNRARSMLEVLFI